MTEMIGATLLGLLLYFTLFFLPNKKKQRSLRLTEYYNGKISWPLGVVQVKVGNSEYRISRISKSKGMHDAGSAYLVLWKYVQPASKIILGHELSKNYTDGKFLILPPYEHIDMKGRKVICGSNDREMIAKMKLSLDNSSAIEAIRFLFDREIHHLTISSEIHLIGLMPKKKYVCRYTCLPDRIYNEPKLLQNYTQLIESLLSNLDVRAEVAQ